MRPAGPAPLLIVPALLLSACVSVVSPRKGTAVEVRPGQALVFGRIRVTSPGWSREFLVFSPDPLEHVVSPDPIFKLELRALRPPGGAVRYATHLDPEVEGDGTFHWILGEGAYVLASNPRPYGSPRFDPSETSVLARFAVPRGAGTVYLGTLDVVVELDPGHVREALRGRETPYTIVRLTVADDGERAFRALLATYPAVPEPRAVVPMVAEPP